jgi:hypothetical protein
MTQWPTKDDPDEVTTNFNAQIATLKEEQVKYWYSTG